jgi:hypothetical protein
MTLESAVVNGVIVLDGARLPEGARVRVELADEGDDDCFPPPEPYDREKELAVLRESLEDVKAGQGVDARQAPKQLAEKYHLPFEPGE